MSKSIKSIASIYQWDVYSGGSLLFSFDKVCNTKIQGKYGESILTICQSLLDVDYLEKILNVDLDEIVLVGKGVATTEKKSSVYDCRVEINNAVLLDYCIEDTLSPILTLRFGFGRIFEENAKVTYELRNTGEW